MEIDKLKENEITVKTLDPAKETEMRQRFIIKFHDILCFLKKYMKQNKYTLEDLRNQVIEKKSYLSKSQRDFLAMWKLEFIQQCFDELKIMEKEAYEQKLSQSGKSRKSQSASSKND